MATQLLSVDELLKSQTANTIEATITADPENDKNVIITPYAGGAFGNSNGISIARESIEGVQKSGEECSCGNHMHNVVTVFLKEDATIPLREFTKYVKSLGSSASFTHSPEGISFPFESSEDGIQLPCHKAESNGPVTFYKDFWGRMCGIKVFNYKIPIKKFTNPFPEHF